MRGSTKQQADGERSRRLVARARELFIEITEKYGLTLEWDDRNRVDLAAYLNRQPGLDWSLWLYLDGDEVGIQNSWFSVEWFPVDYPSRETKFIAALDGLISGSVRLVNRFGARGEVPYSVIFQAETGPGWTNIFGYYNGLHFSRPKGVMILRNGQDPIVEGRACSIAPPE